MSHPARPHAGVRTALDISEKGAPVNGQPQTLDRRLFVQFTAFSGCRNTVPLAEKLASSGLEAALYEDLSDPDGIGIAAISEDPADFATKLRELLHHDPFRTLTLKPEYSMLGRTYAGGYEQDLEEWLLKKPRRTILNPAWPWAVWYPLRRTGEFAKLPPEEQGAVLREHGAIGRTFGEEDLAHDVRLACFGLDKADNDFVIGLIGKELYPLSAVVQAMRRTKQTSTYIEKMGPFFVGRAVWQSKAR
jgi:chlorite dismutase